MGDEATRVSEQLDDLAANTENLSDEQLAEIEAFIEAAVERGTFLPEDVDITMQKEETYCLVNNRFMGKSGCITINATMDVSPLFAIGMILGAALEEDVPTGSDAEERWRSGEFAFPEE